MKHEKDELYVTNLQIKGKRIISNKVAKGVATGNCLRQITILSTLKTLAICSKDPTDPSWVLWSKCKAEGDLGDWVSLPGDRLDGRRCRGDLEGWSEAG